MALASVFVLAGSVATVCFSDYFTVGILAFHYVFPALIGIGWPGVLGGYRTGPRRLAVSTRGLEYARSLIVACSVAPAAYRMRAA